MRKNHYIPSWEVDRPCRKGYRRARAGIATYEIERGPSWDDPEGIAEPDVPWPAGLDRIDPHGQHPQKWYWFLCLFRARTARHPAARAHWAREASEAEAGLKQQEAENERFEAAFLAAQAEKLAAALRAFPSPDV